MAPPATKKQCVWPSSLSVAQITSLYLTIHYDDLLHGLLNLHVAYGATPDFLTDEPAARIRHDDGIFRRRMFLVCFEGLEHGIDLKIFNFRLEGRQPGKQPFDMFAQQGRALMRGVAALSLYLKFHGAKHSDADCDAVADAIIPGSLDGMAETMAEIEQEAIVKAIKAGATDYIVKPIGADALQVRLKSIFSRYFKITA